MAAPPTWTRTDFTVSSRAGRLEKPLARCSMPTTPTRWGRLSAARGRWGPSAGCAGRSSPLVPTHRPHTPLPALQLLHPFQGWSSLRRGRKHRRSGHRRQPKLRPHGGRPGGHQRGGLRDQWLLPCLLAELLLTVIHVTVLHSR